ncbi:3-hydroxyacyl-ACP dehydratase FabZ family protein [Sphingorhabdus sp. EL138]|uniref:3-hydroxyacyl-ACP dehydratase FabZ family protein n=1 Tax=Sphingorhabdus sp. EL138 TaxID=2073156 RepID=UPI000D69FCF3|nr:beta-hydroxyacyl-ACP dehydratase [Sphingorhabdus sp. EL138]
MNLSKVILLDELVDASPSIDAMTFRSTVPKSSTIFEGHFPGFPILPGVLMIEAMAQAAGFISLSRLQAAKMPFLIAVDHARFRSFSNPGDELLVRAELSHEGSGFDVFRGTLKRANELLAKTELRLAIKDFPSDMLKADIIKRLERVGVKFGPSPISGSNIHE